MSVACIAPRRSISSRIALVHGSGPKTPTSNGSDAGSMPRLSSSSSTDRKYDGVTMIARAPKSWSNWICFSVCPPEIGTTVQPKRSAP